MTEDIQPLGRATYSNADRAPRPRVRRQRKSTDSPPPEREPIRKSVRFAVFARDGFTCRYCGRKSDEVKLVIDHVIPVAKGGTNDETNLVTSCEPCNQGKSDKSATPDPDNETARLSRLQVAREQQDAAEAASAVMRAETQFQEAVMDAWRLATGRTEMDRGTFNTMVAYARQHGVTTLCEWFCKAHAKLGVWAKDQTIGRYVSGIRRQIQNDLKGGANA